MVKRIHDRDPLLDLFYEIFYTGPKNEKTEGREALDKDRRRAGRGDLDPVHPVRQGDRATVPDGGEVDEAPVDSGD